MSYWIKTYGIPRRLYCDRKNAFVPTREPADAELPAGISKPKSHFGKACAKPGVEVIAANSPQAKGRVERNHGLDQDRLVKKTAHGGYLDVQKKLDGAICIPRLAITLNFIEILSKKEANRPASDVV